MGLQSKSGRRILFNVHGLFAFPAPCGAPEKPATTMEGIVFKPVKLKDVIENMGMADDILRV